MIKVRLCLVFGVMLLVLVVAITGSSQESSVNNDNEVIGVEQDEGSSSDSTGGDKINKHQVIVYYFHGTRRCPTCKKIESYSEEAVKSHFAGDLIKGKVEWKTVNTDKSENTHFKKEYKLFSSALVVSNQVNSQQTEWKNLDKVWGLVGDKESFIKYVGEEVRAFLGSD